MKEPKKKVVVTGLGLATSLGLDVEESWQKALRGTSGIHRITYPESDVSPVRAVGEVSASDWKRIETEFPEEARTEGERKTLFGLWAAKRALEDAGLLGGSEPSARHGVVFASGLGINRLEDLQRWMARERRFDTVRFGKEHRGVHRESIIRNNSNRTAVLISHRFGLLGINATVTSACASGTQAMGI